MDEVVKMVDVGICVEFICSISEYDQEAFCDFFNNLPVGSYVLSTEKLCDCHARVRVFCSSDSIQECEKYFVERGVLDVNC